MAEVQGASSHCGPRLSEHFALTKLGDCNALIAIAINFL